MHLFWCNENPNMNRVIKIFLLVFLVYWQVIHFTVRALSILVIRNLCKCKYLVDIRFGNILPWYWSLTTSTYILKCGPCIIMFKGVGSYLINKRNIKLYIYIYANSLLSCFVFCNMYIKDILSLYKDQINNMKAAG